MANTALSQARQVYRQAIPNLFKRRNVIACGLGYKVSEGERTDELSLIVSVVRKVPKEELTPQDLVPQSVDGLTTDVVEIGYIKALMSNGTTDPRARHRPAPPGVSIGHRDVTAGTFGLLVERNGDPMILSNNHVIANSNNARVGDPIYQPGRVDGGTADDQIATLSDFVPLDFGESPAQCPIAETLASLLNLMASISGSSHRMQAVQRTAGDNVMDAALGLPDSPDLVIPEIMNIGRPTGIGEPTLGLGVQKMGRTTGLTQGIVTQVDVAVNVDYDGRIAHFTDQVITSRMSSPGDSGSSILDMDRNVVGLLFAGSDSVTIFSPIQRILDHFNVGIIS